MPPQITVLMPVRDGARWIAEAIGSALAQTFKDFELVIVDDGSADATAAVVSGFASRDSRIVLISQPPCGLIAALNAGLKAARAPLTARLDADDVAAPQRLARQFDAMQRDGDLALLGSWATEIDDSGRLVGARRPEADPEKLKLRLASGNPMIHPSVMFRTAAARDAGGYRAAFAAAEDYDLWLRLAERGRIANLAEELIRYRVHAGSVSAREPLQQMYATRLAQRSASLRRAGTDDPLAGRDGPLRIADDAPEPYADIARLYRFLSWRQAGAGRGALPPSQELLGLSRRERTLAQQAMARMLAARPDLVSVASLGMLCGLRPSRALPALWRLWTQSADGR